MDLAQARAFALSLPEAQEAPHFELTSFRVGGRIFASAPTGGAYLHCFVADELRQPLIACAPETYAPLRWGNQVVGLRVDLASAIPEDVNGLLLAGWRARAPRRLVKEFTAAAEGRSG